MLICTFAGLIVGTIWTIFSCSVYIKYIFVGREHWNSDLYLRITILAYEPLESWKEKEVKCSLGKYIWEYERGKCA